MFDKQLLSLPASFLTPLRISLYKVMPFKINYFCFSKPTGKRSVFFLFMNLFYFFFYCGMLLKGQSNRCIMSSVALSGGFYVWENIKIKWLKAEQLLRPCGEIVFSHVFSKVNIEPWNWVLSQCFLMTATKGRSECVAINSLLTNSLLYPWSLC